MAEHQRVLRAETADTRRELKEDIFNMRRDTREEISKSTAVVADKVKTNELRLEEHETDIREIKETLTTILARMKGGYLALGFVMSVIVFFLAYGDKILSHIK